MLCRRADQLVEPDGLGKLILLRFEHFGTFSEALTGCGAFSFWRCRQLFSLSLFDTLATETGFNTVQQ